MAKAFHFHGRRDSETAVRLYLIGPDFVFSRPEKGTAKVKVGCPLVAWIAGNRSSLETGRFASPLFDPCRSRIGFALGDLVIAAAGLSVVADSVVPVVAVGFAAVVGFAVDLAAIADSSAFVVCPFAAVMAKATAAVAAASCSSGHR